jgi:hypothetical protein
MAPEAPELQDFDGFDVGPMVALSLGNRAWGNRAPPRQPHRPAGSPSHLPPNEAMTPIATTPPTPPRGVKAESRDFVYTIRRSAPSNTLMTPRLWRLL